MEMIFFENAKAFDNFTNGNLKLSGQASAVAATHGASADAAYQEGMAIFTLAKGGLMYEASVGGARLCEMNVRHQLRSLCHTRILREAWKDGRELTVHGWIYSIEDGLLHDLGTPVRTFGVEGGECRGCGPPRGESFRRQECR